MGLWLKREGPYELKAKREGSYELKAKKKRAL